MATKTTGQQPPPKSDAAEAHALGWDDAVDPTQTGGGKYTLLPEGPVYCAVSALKRERGAFGKFGTINIAVLTIAMQSVEGEGTEELQ